MNKWYQYAIGEIGVKEVVGGENPRILEYHATTSLHADEDETAWCSAFMNWCFKQAGVKGTGSAAAASWETWGDKLDAPVQGCVVVLHHHVTFYDCAHAGGVITCLGGNQGNMVKYSQFKERDVISYRWPKGDAK